MTWIKPDFEEIALCMEVTAYVNTAGDELPVPAEGDPRHPLAQTAVNEQPRE